MFSLQLKTNWSPYHSESMGWLRQTTILWWRDTHTETKLHNQSMHDTLIGTNTQFIVHSHFKLNRSKTRADDDDAMRWKCQTKLEFLNWNVNQSKNTCKMIDHLLLRAAPSSFFFHSIGRVVWQTTNVTSIAELEYFYIHISLIACAGWKIIFVPRRRVNQFKPLEMCERPLLWMWLFRTRRFADSQK